MVKPLILQAATCFMVMVGVSFAQAHTLGCAPRVGWSYAGVKRQQSEFASNGFLILLCIHPSTMATVP